MKMRILLLCLLQSCSASNIKKDKELIRAPFDGNRFNNIEPFEGKDFLSLLKWRVSRKTKNWDNVENQVFYKPTFQRTQNLKLTLIGHSTVLVQLNNINIRRRKIF